MDAEGSWNGTTFTITVVDSTPRFFYTVDIYFVNNCSLLGDWDERAELPADTDEVFALNPVECLSVSMTNFVE